MLKTNRGFTLVELLIVIVVIGILSALILNTFSGVQNRARVAAATHDLAALNRALTVVKQNEAGSLTLTQVTGNLRTFYSCYTAGLPINKLPKTHQCWLDYYSFIDKISDDTGVPLEDFRKGDPWGGPYLIDENEGEADYGGPTPECLRQDWVASAGPNGILFGAGGSDDLFFPISRIKPSPDC